jgi:hypothetical protein
MLLLVCSLGFITLNSRFNKIGISGVIPSIIEGDWIIDEDVVLNRIGRLYIESMSSDIHIVLLDFDDKSNMVRGVEATFQPKQCLSF